MAVSGRGVLGPAGAAAPQINPTELKGPVMKLLNILRRFRKDESGASMVEYGVALLVIVAIGVGAMTILGDAVAANVTDACAALNVVC